MDFHLRSRSGRMMPETSNPCGLTGRGRAKYRRDACSLGRAHDATRGVGDDALSNHVLEQTTATGVNTDRVLRVPEVGCGLYAALLHADGELAIAASAMDAVDQIDPPYIEANVDVLAGSDLVVVDANLPVDAIGAVLVRARAHEVPVIAEPVSLAKGRRLAGVDGWVLAVTPNEHEAQAFVAADARVAAEWIVVTRGSSGVRLLSGRSTEGGQPVVAAELPGRPVKAVDVTGAGDALVAGLAYGLVNGCSMRSAVELGMEAARATVLESGSVCTSLDADAVTRLLESGCA